MHCRAFEFVAAHIPVALQGLLGKLDPELRARLKQQLRLTYLKS